MRLLVLILIACINVVLLKAQPVVLLDAFYNNETKKDASGKLINWHYAWEDRSDGGFADFGKLFSTEGAILKTLYSSASKNNLANASIYIIVDPDHVKDNASPHYMNEKDANAIAKWVKKGGVLLLMANDSLNCDIDHFNILAKKFGIEFLNRSVNMVKGINYDMGKVFPTKGNMIFSEGLNIFMKDVSALSISKNVTSVANNGDDVIVAHSTFGMGHVIAVGDPWLYNEYISHRKLPNTFQNTAAAEQLVKALIRFSTSN